MNQVRPPSNPRPLSTSTCEGSLCRHSLVRPPQVRGESRPLKRRIEERFDEIKRATESSKFPELTNSQRDWLQAITQDVHAMMLRMPHGLQERMGQVLELLRNAWNA